MGRNVSCGVILSLVLASCFLTVSADPVPPEPDQAIGRSLSIIRSATPEKPQVLKVLFYGQSISTPKWTDQAIATLRARYPNVAFDYRNLALGGWSAVLLEQAVARDVEEVYPDLIVFMCMAITGPTSESSAPFAPKPQPTSSFKQTTSFIRLSLCVTLAYIFDGRRQRVVRGIFCSSKGAGRSSCPTSGPRPWQRNMTLRWNRGASAGMPICGSTTSK